MIANGQTLSFTVNGTTGQWLPRTVAGVRQDAIDNLTPFFDVESVSVNSPTFASDPIHYIANWPFTAYVRATMRSDYGDVRDVDAIVAHAFYEATGEIPTVTADDEEPDQAPPSETTGFSLTTLAVVLVIGLVALAVIQVER